MARAEIVLPSGTEFVDTHEVPDLIAAALNPDVPDDIRYVERIIKVAKPGVVPNKVRRNGLPLNDKDLNTVMACWSHLAPSPITEKAWPEYKNAFNTRASRRNWTIFPEYHSPRETVLLKRVLTAEEHRRAIKKAIRNGELTTLNPLSHIPQALPGARSIVTVDELERYVSTFKIDLRLDSISDRKIDPGNEAASVVQSEGKGHTKREKQICAIEQVSDNLGYERRAIPDRGKAAIRAKCKSLHARLFGAGNDPFNEAWQEAVRQNRIRMKNHDKYSRR